MKYLHRTCLLVVLVMLGGGFLQAQQGVSYVYYWELQPQYNPAAVGRSEQLSLNGAYQVHASGFDDAGNTMYSGADIALRWGRTRHGVGALFEKDEIGLFDHKRFALQYAYHLGLWGGRLSLGVQADMLAETFNGSRADLEDGNDPAIPTTDLNGSKVDASVGMMYHYNNKWYAGASVQHLMQPTVLLGTSNQLKYKSVWYATGGYRYALKWRGWCIEPSALVRYDGLELRGDMTGKVLYDYDKKQMFAGMNYAPKHSVAFFVGGVFHGVRIGYAYEMFTEGMGAAAGNHEINISYRLPLNLEKRKKNLHKSVRFL